MTIKQRIKHCLYVLTHYEEYSTFRSQVKQFGYKADDSYIEPMLRCTCPRKIYLYEHTNIYGQAKFIINPHGEGGRFIMKKWSGSAEGLTVITGNHTTTPIIGDWHKKYNVNHEHDIDKDVIVEEDVWIGANVTLCANVIVGRGSIIGTGSVVRNSVPPYSIVFGNPAKVVGFKFTPDEVIKHEISLYSEEERLSIDALRENYNKYFLKRIKSIKEFVK